MSATVGVSWFSATRRAWQSRAAVPRDVAAAMVFRLVRDPDVEFVTVDDERPVA